MTKTELAKRLLKEDRSCYTCYYYGTSADNLCYRAVLTGGTRKQIKKEYTCREWETHPLGRFPQWKSNTNGTKPPAAFIGNLKNETRKLMI